MQNDQTISEILPEEGMTFLVRALGAGALGIGVGGMWLGGGKRAEVPAPLTYLVVFLFPSDWRPALNVAALDCADETNSEICRDFDIPGFPTVRVRDREGSAGVVRASRAPRASELRGVLPSASVTAPGALSLGLMRHLL